MANELNNTPVEPPTKEMWVCQNCDEHFEGDGDFFSLYECECGETFTPETSNNGRNQCPSCYKWAPKISDEGCSICNEGFCEWETVEVEREEIR